MAFFMGTSPVATDVREDTLALRFSTAIGRGAWLAAAVFLATAPLAAAPLAAAPFAAAPLATAPFAAQAAAAAPLSGPGLIQRLRAGGCVLVMRHAQSPNAVPDARTARADNPHRERQLDEAGEAGALAFGAAVRALGVSIGPIYSSPTYRARETVRLARLGTPQIIEQLAESKRGMSGAAERSEIEWLREAVARRPPAHSNTLIVTHTPNIVGAFPSEAARIASGESLIFEPRRTGGARLLGRITVQEWQRLAGQLARHR